MAKASGDMEEIGHHGIRLSEHYQRKEAFIIRPDPEVLQFYGGEVLDDSTARSASGQLKQGLQNLAPSKQYCLPSVSTSTQRLSAGGSDSEQPLALCAASALL